MLHPVTWLTEPLAAALNSTHLLLLLLLLTGQCLWRDGRHGQWCNAGTLLLQGCDNCAAVEQPEVIKCALG